MGGHLSLWDMSPVWLIISDVCLPFSWRDNLHDTASHPPSLDAVHVAFEILELLHSWLEDRDAPLGEWIIFGVEVGPSMGVWRVVDVLKSIKMVGLNNCMDRRCGPGGCQGGRRTLV